MFSLFKKSWLFLDHKQKKYGIFLFILMFVAMILESLSVGIAVPLLSILLKGEIETSFISYLFVFGNPTGDSLIYIGLFLTVIIFLLKNSTLTFNLWHQSKFIQKLQFDLTNRLFKRYLRSDYMFFLQANSAILFKNLNDHTNQFANYMRLYMILCGEVIVFLGIACVLFSVDFFGTFIILFAVGLVAFILYKLTVEKLSSMGAERVLALGELNKHLLQGMHSAKDIKILDREEDLILQVDKNLFKWCRVNQLAQFISGLPKYSFEILIVCAFSSLILVMMSVNRDMNDIIIYLGVFAVASIRIVPGAAKILHSFQTIKYIEPTIKILLKEFDFKDNSLVERYSQQNKIKNNFKFQKEINLSKLSFSYPTRKEFSLTNISMTIQKGDFIGIIGMTGSGKSSLINLLMGLIKPSEGTVEADGLNINSNIQGWYKKIGHVPQSVYLTDDSIKKNIAFGLREEDIDENLINKAIEKASLNEFINSLADGTETIVGEKGVRISGGQQQRIGIARALYRNPEILILDEATSSLDHETEKKIMESVEVLKKEKTVIVVTHRLNTVKNCDKIFFIENGKVSKQGTPNEVLK